MIAQKLLETMRWRLAPDMAEAVRLPAELDDRTVQHEVRQLIRLGLEQERKRVRRVQGTPNRWLVVKKFFQLFGESWEGRK